MQYILQESEWPALQDGLQVVDSTSFSVLKIQSPFSEFYQERKIQVVPAAADQNVHITIIKQMRQNFCRAAQVTIAR